MNPMAPTSHTLQTEESTEPEPTGHLPKRFIRLARLAWILLLIVFAWQLVTQFVGRGDILLVLRSEWLVQTGLLAVPDGLANFFIRYLLLMRLVVVAVFWGTASLIFWRQRYDRMALFVAFLLLSAPVAFAMTGDENWLEEWLGLPTLGLMVLLLFLFPDGRLVPRSTRWRLALLAGVLLPPFLAGAIIGLNRPEAQAGERAYGSFIFTVAVTMILGLVSQVYRYRKLATAVQRQQTKWVVLGMGFVLIWMVFAVLWFGGALPRLGVPEPLLALVMTQLGVFALVALPLTIGISILRYRLWDIDLIINRTLVFGGLTLLVAATYILVVGILGTLLQADNNLFLSILAIGLIAILFQPLRQHLQQGVNRLMYGERDEPFTVLTRLGKQLENIAVPEATLPGLVTTIAQVLKLPYVAIWQDGGYGRGDQERQAALVAAYGQPAGQPVAFPLAYQGQRIGQLLVAPRAPGESFAPAETHLLENIARQAGAAVYAYQLTDQLQYSRERLVTTREEERRRLRRDLHDGLGPQLASMTLKVDAARNYLDQEPASSDQLLVELKREIQEAIQDVRRLAYALRPPALDQLGLVSALSEYATQNSINGLLITVSAPERLPALSAAVEVAAYRIALEAMTNVGRHAQASQCNVQLLVSDGLCLEIWDNGLGLPVQPASGVGLTSMRERASELGGIFDLQSVANKGTRVSVRLPIMEVAND
jgi:signal transduction histidine kinase